MNITKTSQNVDRKIEVLKEKLLKIGNMRPGSISRQWNVCGKKNCRCKNPVKPQKHGPYYQLSYVHEGKSTSRFIKKHLLPQVTQETKEYKKFKALIETWIKLSLKKANQSLKASPEK